MLQCKVAGALCPPSADGCTVSRPLVCPGCHLIKNNVLEYKQAGGIGEVDYACCYIGCQSSPGTQLMVPVNGVKFSSFLPSAALGCLLPLLYFFLWACAAPLVCSQHIQVVQGWLPPFQSAGSLGFSVVLSPASPLYGMSLVESRVLKDQLLYQCDHLIWLCVPKLLLVLFCILAWQQRELPVSPKLKSSPAWDACCSHVILLCQAWWSEVGTAASIHIGVFSFASFSWFCSVFSSLLEPGTAWCHLRLLTRGVWSLIYISSRMVKRNSWTIIPARIWPWSPRLKISLHPPSITSSSRLTASFTHIFPKFIFLGKS